jgi:hypothetical protein
MPLSLHDITTSALHSSMSVSLYDITTSALQFSMPFSLYDITTSALHSNLHLSQVYGAGFSRRLKLEATGQNLQAQ